MASGTLHSISRAAGLRLGPLWAYMRLLRPLNVALFVVGTLVGAIMAGGADVLVAAEAWWAAAAAACIGAAANAVNDAFDAKIDAVNRPDRPIPSGAVSVRGARWIWGLLSVAGIAIAWKLSSTHAAIAVGSVALLYAYSARLKRLPVSGNLAVAVVVALALLFGGLAVGSATAAAAGAVFAFLTTLSREIAKDAEDLVGDLAGGARTLAAVLGAETACDVAIVPAALVLIVSPLPYVVLGFPEIYLLVLLPSGLALVSSVARLRRRDAGGASRALKMSMGLGLLALAVSAL